MVLPAISAIQKNSNTTPTLVSRVTSILSVVGAASLPIFGRLEDIYWSKKAFLTARGMYIIRVVVPGSLLQHAH